MGWLKKKPDPLSERTRALNAEIAALESEIRKLDAQLQQPDTSASPRLRSTALPHGQTLSHAPGLASSVLPPAPAPSTVQHEPVFEDVDRHHLRARGEADASPERFNELGVRKYDLPALVVRMRNLFRGPSTTNPKLVSYLAAGGVQGLRPLRYEKRVARNRFIALVIILFLLLLGIVTYVLRR